MMIQTKKNFFKCSLALSSMSLVSPPSKTWMKFPIFNSSRHLLPLFILEPQSCFCAQSPLYWDHLHQEYQRHPIF